MSFLEFYNAILNTEVASYAALPYPVKKANFKKGLVITDYGQIENAVYFLNSGIVEMTVKSYVSEKMIDFFFENEMFTSLTSFLNQRPSDVQMTALTDCKVEMIIYEDLMAAYENSLDANKLGRIVIEQAYLNKARREKDFLAKTAEERYVEMFRTHSKYLSNIPVNKIAKYLGIHPESLSRIRGKMNS
ncbi:cyclic nucleotide-binding domain-containing protein [Arenibacter algicola]|uniref:Crp/Fnr family transcriptional regulator n=1 Tax=Arenibacter algicola TaxID=616991 RepID=UPI001C064FAC|nr:cyclic nucleotide-binding domain-containing protein [Arenibacter algicola]MBU2903895.1 cyclic nucleotide-binding domain-containing protein [Arenibacter algicola]